MLKVLAFHEYLRDILLLENENKERNKDKNTKRNKINGTLTNDFNGEKKKENLKYFNQN